MDLVKIVRFDSWLAERLQPMRCGPDTRAYVISVLDRYQRDVDRIDMSQESIVLAFYAARQRGDFEAFQRVGDWVLWASSVGPHHDKGQRDMVETFGRLAYYSCHRVLRGSWPLYEELANELPAIVYDVRCNLHPGPDILGL